MHVSILTAPIHGPQRPVEARWRSCATSRGSASSRPRCGAASARRARPDGAGPAHEIRNPLGAIRGVAQLLGRELGGAARFREHADGPADGDRPGQPHHRGLLDLGAAAAPSPSVREPPRAPRARGPPRRGGAREPTGPARPALRSEPAAASWADEDRLIQVFHNLVRNAIEAMAGRRPAHADHPAVSSTPLFGKVDLGTGPRRMVEVQVIGRGRGHPGRERSHASSIRSSPPRTAGSASASPSATASSRSTAAPSRSRAARARAPPSVRSCRSPDRRRPRRARPSRPVRADPPPDDAARILVADDEDSLRWVLERVLRQAGHDVTVGEGRRRRRSAPAEAEPFDLVFLDVRMPGIDGLERALAAARLRARRRVVVMTAHGSVRAAVEAMQRGAYDYLTKPFDIDEVRLLAERALARRRADAARSPSSGPGSQEVCEFGALVGKSPAHAGGLQDHRARSPAPTSPSCSRGESGTGKELVARAIHHYSRRAGTAVRGRLLRGHSRRRCSSRSSSATSAGAFTGAHRAPARHASSWPHGGTLFLDEIGDLAAGAAGQAAARAPGAAVERVGGGEPIRVDVRVVAATNRDLETLDPGRDASARTSTTG